MNNKDLLKLIKKASKDNSSFELLIRQYNSLISYYSNYYYLDGYGRDDIKNMIITIIWNSLKDYDPNKSQFNSYITKKINLTFFNLIRDSRRQKRSPDKLVSLDSKSDDHQYSLGETLSSDVGSSYEDVEEFEYLNNKLLEELSSKEKLVYSSLMKRYTGKELANRLDCSVKSIDNTLNRIRSKAKRVYNDYKRRQGDN